MIELIDFSLVLLTSDLLHWSSVLKYVIILLTAILGFSNEIRDRFLKSKGEPQPGKKLWQNRLYIVGLLTILAFTLYTTWADGKDAEENSLTAKKEAEQALRETQAAHTAQKRIDSLLNVSLTSAENRQQSTDSLIHLSEKAARRNQQKLDSMFSISENRLAKIISTSDSINAISVTVLRNSENQMTYSDSIISSIKNFNKTIKGDFIRMSLPIENFAISMTLWVDSLDKKYPDFYKLIKRLPLTWGTKSKQFDFFKTNKNEFFDQSGPLKNYSGLAGVISIRRSTHYLLQYQFKELVDPEQKDKISQLKAVRVGMVGTSLRIEYSSDKLLKTVDDATLYSPLDIYKLVSDENMEIVIDVNKLISWNYDKLRKRVDPLSIRNLRFNRITDFQIIMNRGYVVNCKSNGQVYEYEKNQWRIPMTALTIQEPNESFRPNVVFEIPYEN